VGDKRGRRRAKDSKFHRRRIIVMSSNWILTLLALLCVNAAHAGYALPVEKRAASHEHWEHIAKRSAEAARLDDNYEDDTAHIVNIQDYYRQVFDEGWEDYRDREQELVEELHYLQRKQRSCFDCFVVYHIVAQCLSMQGRQKLPRGGAADRSEQ